MMSTAAKSQPKPIVFVVDDDISVRQSLELLIKFAGLKPETFPSAVDFLARPRTTTPSCLVLDVSELIDIEREAMSRYLIRRIEETPNIELHTNTEVIALEGTDHLESVTWRDNQTVQDESHNIAHLFSMTGAVPNSAWLNGCVACDHEGFIKTGLDLTTEDLAKATWPLNRPPYLLETPLNLKEVRCP